MAKHKAYDTDAAKRVTLGKIISIFKDLGSVKLYAKCLAPNDNSKNQPYLGGHLTDLAFIPTGEPIPSPTTSTKSRDPKRQIKYQVPTDFSWVDADGSVYRAPNTKLIYYPQYPEVRLSGFLLGSQVDAGEWMNRYKKGTSLGRWLIIGVTPKKMVYGYLVTPECQLSNELENTKFLDIGSVFGQIDLDGIGVTDTRAALLNKLLQIHHMGWIFGQRLKGDGSRIDYKALNGGGYTLESLLDIIPNGISQPDYLGWEVKQFGVSEFPQKSPKPTTLMAPEPDGGIYKTRGATEFVRAFGYPDKSGIPDRINFGGRHSAKAFCKATSLTLHVEGFDEEAGQITDASGAITLRNDEGTLAVSWSFAKIMNHWKRKHAQAVYVPCMMRPAGKGREYHYGSQIELGVGTDFEMFLLATLKRAVYYDPGIKLENASSDKSKLKVRSQFRANHRDLPTLYSDMYLIDLLES